MENKQSQKLEIYIEATVHDSKALKEIVKDVAEIQKEHSCNCTLNVKMRG